MSNDNDDIKEFALAIAGKAASRRKVSSEPLTESELESICNGLLIARDYWLDIFKNETLPSTALEQAEVYAKLLGRIKAILDV